MFADYGQAVLNVFASPWFIHGGFYISWDSVVESTACWHKLMFYGPDSALITVSGHRRTFFRYPKSCGTFEITGGGSTLDWGPGGPGRAMAEAFDMNRPADRDGQAVVVGRGQSDYVCSRSLVDMGQCLTRTGRAIAEVPFVSDYSPIYVIGARSIEPIGWIVLYDALEITLRHRYRLMESTALRPEFLEEGHIFAA